MTAAFVKVRAEREQPFRALEMVAPTSRFVESVLALAAVLDASDYCWTAKPVGELGLRSESAVEAQ